MNESIKFIVLSGHDDFQYVREAMKLGIENYLLKPVNEEELSQTLLNTIDKIKVESEMQLKSQEDSAILRENILYRWVTGTIDAFELAERAEISDFTINNAAFSVAVIRLFNLPVDNVIRNINSYRLSLINICRKAAAKTPDTEVFFDLDGDIVLLFSGDWVDDNTRVRCILEDCLTKINDVVKLDAFIAMGSKETDFNDVHTSYANAKSMMGYMLIYNLNCIVDYQSKRLNDQPYMTDLDIQVDQLRHLLLYDKLEEAEKFIDKTYNEAFANPSLTPESIQLISIELLHVMIDVIKERKLPSKDLLIFRNDPFKTVYIIKSRTELVVMMKETAEAIILAIKNATSHINPSVKRIVEYIEANYSRDISLKLLSGEMNTNASYLGQLFKNETGEMFTAYLNKVRIEKAKKLLINSKLNANEISLLVGYMNTNYFYSCFKKITGMFPTEFRKR
jgi:two-component system, response regulator YesN